MKIINDTKKDQDRIHKSISKHGWAAEHNYHHYEQHCYAKRKNVFFKFNDDMGAMFRKHDCGDWYMFGEVLAPKEKQLELLKKVIEHILFEKRDKKAILEVHPWLRKELLRLQKTEKFRVLDYDKLTWPIINVKNWDPRMPGKEWKKLRNYVNRFYREHNVEILSSNEFSKKELMELIKQWRDTRNAKDQIDTPYYMNIIRSGFAGYDMTRTVVIDGKPCSITGGWKIPNTNTYYSAIGLYDYNYDRIGEIASVDDLNQIKAKGFDYADFGGSDKNLLAFKMKFKPERFYNTLIFSVMRKKGL